MPQPKVWFALLLVAGAGAVWVPRFLPGGDAPGDAIDVEGWNPRPHALPLPPPTSGASTEGSASDRRAIAGDASLDEESRVLLELAQRLRGGAPASASLSPSAAAVDTGTDVTAELPPAGEAPPAGWDLSTAAVLELEAVAASHPLTATLVGPAARAAVLGGRVLRVGDPVTPRGPRVVAIEAQRVRIELAGEQLELEMAPFRVAARASGDAFDEAAEVDTRAEEVEE